MYVWLPVTIHTCIVTGFSEPIYILQALNPETCFNKPWQAERLVLFPGCTLQTAATTTAAADMLGEEVELSRTWTLMSRQSQMVTSGQIPNSQFSYTCSPSKHKSPITSQKLVRGSEHNAVSILPPTTAIAGYAIVLQPLR